jgi:hypothetical protein
MSCEPLLAGARLEVLEGGRNASAPIRRPGECSFGAALTTYAMLRSSTLCVWNEDAWREAVELALVLLSPGVVTQRGSQALAEHSLLTATDADLELLNAVHFACHGHAPAAISQIALQDARGLGLIRRRGSAPTPAGERLMRRYGWPGEPSDPARTSRARARRAAALLAAPLTEVVAHG